VTSDTANATVTSRTTRALAITAPHDAQRQGQNQTDEETHEDLPLPVRWGRRNALRHT
jgi:hypothetical protein